MRKARSMTIFVVFDLYGHITFQSASLDNELSCSGSLLIGVLGQSLYVPSLCGLLSAFISTKQDRTLPPSTSEWVWAAEPRSWPLPPPGASYQLPLSLAGGSLSRCCHLSLPPVPVTSQPSCAHSTLASSVSHKSSPCIGLVPFPPRSPFCPPPLPCAWPAVPPLHLRAWCSLGFCVRGLFSVLWVRRHACQVSSVCSTLCNPWTLIHQAPLSLGFSR